MCRVKDTLVYGQKAMEQMFQDYHHESTLDLKHALIKYICVHGTKEAFHFVVKILSNLEKPDGYQSIRELHETSGNQHQIQSGDKQ